MPETNAAQAVIAPDPADYGAWEKHEMAVQSGEIPAETPQPPTPAGSDETKQPEIPSEPAGEKPGKAETQSVPEADKKIESREENKSGAGTNEEHGPGWYRRELKRLRRETRDEIEQLRRQLAERSIPEPATAPSTEPSEPPEPKIDDFDTHEDYLLARATYRAEKAAAKKIAEFQSSVQRQLEAEDQAARQQRIAEELASADAKWATKVNAAAEKYEDFEEVVFRPNLGITPTMDQFAHESESGADVAYHLASRPEEIARIRALTPLQQIRELVKIEAQFSEKPKTPIEKPKASPSRPITPTTPIGGGGSISAAPDDPNNPEIAGDYKRWERLELARLKKR